MRNFKRAVFATLAFLLCLALMVEVIVWPYFNRPNYFYEDARVRADLAGSIDTLVSGSSQGACAFNTRILDETLGANSYNLSGPLMTMEARRTLLKKEIARNPVKTVFIELSFNALTRNRRKEGPEGELYAMTRMDGIWERTAYFFKAVRPEEYFEVGNYNLHRGFDAWSAMLHHKPTELDPEVKGYLARPSVDFSMDSEEFASLHHTYSFKDEDRWDNKLAFFDLVESCQAKGIEVVFVTTPLADRLLALYDGFEHAHQDYLYYAEKYHCTYLDFNLYRDRDALFPDDTAFYDRYHLSESGAETFTRELVSLYERIRAGEDISGLFYEDYAALDAAMTEAYGTP